jgi:hypothetical protein
MSFYGPRLSLHRKRRLAVDHVSAQSPQNIGCHVATDAGGEDADWAMKL